MPATRKTMPIREEIEALITLTGQLVTDLTALRATVLADQSGARARSQLSATVTDLTDIRTKLAAAVVDLGSVRTPAAALVVDLTAVLARFQNGTLSWGNLAAATVNGKIKLQSAVDYAINGRLYGKAITDNLWDLTGQSSTDGTHYRAIWLYLDNAGTASIAAGTDALDLASAVAALPALAANKSVIGCYIAGPNTVFTNALAGTFVNGWPGAYTMTAAAPSALTATAPAALTTTTTVTTTSGTTAGKAKSRADVDYVIGGTLYRKVATDDLWDLSAETDTTGAQYRAYRLYLDSSGTASVGAGTNAASAAAALAALPSEPSTKATIAIYVASPSCDFNGVAGLAAQGTFYEGGHPTEANPAALTADAITSIGA